MDISMMRACVRALRSAGGYQGDIVILTDLPSAAPQLAPLLVSPLSATVAAVPPVDAHMTRAWWLKSQIFSFIPTKYQLVMYLDTDVIATSPLKKLFDTIPAFGFGTIGVFSEETTRFSPQVGLHGGVLMMQRGASEQCLQVQSHVTCQRATLLSMRMSQVNLVTGTTLLALRFRCMLQRPQLRSHDHDRFLAMHHAQPSTAHDIIG